MPAPGPNAAHGTAKVEFALDGGATRLKYLYQSGSLRVKFPRTGGGTPEAVLLNTAGGITGGDRFRCDVRVHHRAGAVMTTQAAEKIYRSAGGEATVATYLRVDTGGWLAWVPQETILFDRSRLRRRLSLSVADGGRALACETLVFGRRCRGESVRTGFLHDSWEVRQGGRLAWADVLALEGDLHELLSRPTVTGGATTLTTLVWVASDAPDLLGPVRELLAGAQATAAATAFDGLLLVRLAAEDSFAGRQILFPLLGLLFGLANLAGALPRVWSL